MASKDSRITPKKYDDLDKLEGPDSKTSNRQLIERSKQCCRPDERILHSNTISWWVTLISLILVSFATRLYKISEPEHVCWDETHFGKMGSWYINGTFFFDVHPPLGKMLVGLSGYLTNYRGNFSFIKPGDKYGDTPYVGMRVVCAVLGALLGPLCFGSVWELSHSILAAVIASCFVVFDTGVLTLSQYILLDPYMMFFMMAATYAHLRFTSVRKREFEAVWWFWLAVTGVFLACAISVKFVGLFVVLLVGISTAYQLWELIGDMSLSLWSFLKHFMARAACLILLPLIIYAAFFMVHFRILTKSGPGDGFFSSAFQSQLKGNKLYNASMPESVAYGSVITMKNYRTGGAYLHSHWHLYPEGVGAKQQQVTTYSHKDDNNMWIIKKSNLNPAEGDAVELVRNGDLIRLQHVATKRNLHSHRVQAPMTRRHYQITCYGENGTGDANDVFRIEMAGVSKGVPLKTVKTTFILVHLNTCCALHSHNKQLPKWGWEQLEVTCNPNLKSKNNLWNVEEVIDARLPNKSFEVYSPSFLEKFIESHAVMFQGNSGLKPKEGEVTSKPWQWPINYKGQPFSGLDYRIYLLGNPVLWWTNLVTLAVYLMIYVFYAVKQQRRSADGKYSLPDDVAISISACNWLFIGWVLHYLPFWTMGRVLYFHHYFPAYLFNCMITGIILDLLLNKIKSVINENSSWVLYHVTLGLLFSSIIYSFYLFSPLSYGMQGPRAGDVTSVMYNLNWLDSWDL